MKKQIAMASIMGLLSTAPVMSYDDYKKEASEFDVSVSGDLLVGGTYDFDAEDGNFDLGESTITLSAGIRNKIRAVLTFKLEEMIESGDLKWNDDFDVEEFIKEAYIEIKNIGGIPMAVIVGKHQMAFGENVEEIPFPHLNPAHTDILEIDEVMGLTLRLDGVLGLFDSLDISFFEQNEGDLELGEVNGFSVKLTKNLSSTLR